MNVLNFIDQFLFAERFGDLIYLHIAVLAKIPYRGVTYIF